VVEFRTRPERRTQKHARRVSGQTNRARSRRTTRRAETDCEARSVPDLVPDPGASRDAEDRRRETSCVDKNSF